MTMGNRSNRKRSFAAAPQEVEMTNEQAVLALINGELDTDNLSEDEIQELFDQVPEEHIETLVENNPELKIEEDDGEEETDGEEEATIEDIIANNSEADVIAAIDSGELVITDDEGNELDPDSAIVALYDDGEDGEDETEETEETEEDNPDRSFAGYDGEGQEIYIDQFGNYYDAEGDEVELIEFEETPANRSFAGGGEYESAEDAYERGRQEAIADAEDAAQRVYSENRETEHRSFALEQSLSDSDELVNELVAEGRIMPSDVPIVTAMLYAGASIGGNTRSFSAAEMGEFGDNSLLDIMTGFLQSRPVNPMFEEFNEPGEESIRAFSAAEFQNMHHDPELSREIDRAVRGVMAVAAENGEDVGYMEALNALQEESLGTRKKKRF